MRGRKPKPTALKLLEGTRVDRVNLDEPKFGLADTAEPLWLAGLALEHWRELAPILAGAGVLRDADRNALAMLCDEYQRWRTDPDDSKSRDRYRRLLVEFGLTPSSRSKIKAPAEKPADELEDFLGAKKAQ